MIAELSVPLKKFNPGFEKRWEHIKIVVLKFMDAN